MVFLVIFLKGYMVIYIVNCVLSEGEYLDIVKIDG